MATAPTGTSGKGYKNGSSITYDGGDTIYALKGSYNECFAYSIAGKNWVSRETLPKIAPPGTKKTKVKDGSQIASDRQHSVFAVKGANTNEFWQYKTNEHKWYIATALTTGPKRVKGGGGLTYATDNNVFYAFRGNNTLEFWQYNPGTSVLTPEHKDEGVMSAGSQANLDYRLSVTPNPFTGRAVISYSLPRAGNVSLRLYNLTGALVSALASGYHTAGSYSYSLLTTHYSLASGIYLLEFESDGYNTTSKLIIE
jgi:hypothetical protein